MRFLVFRPLLTPSLSRLRLLLSSLIRSLLSFHVREEFARNMNIPCPQDRATVLTNYVRPALYATALLPVVAIPYSVPGALFTSGVRVPWMPRHPRTSLLLENPLSVFDSARE